MKKIATLQITSWSGVSIGAQHTYGEIIGNDENGEYKRERVTRRLTKATAQRLNDQKGDAGNEHHGIYRAGDETECFDSSQHVRRAALRKWKAWFPDSLVLLEGRSAVADPQPCIAGDEEARALINALYRRAYKTGGYEQNPDAMGKISDEYWSWVCADEPAADSEGVAE